MSRPQSDEDSYVQIAQRSYITVAEKLEAVARRMRQLAERIPSDRTSAVGKAAEAVSEYTQGVGAIGTHLWAIVNDAERLDRCRREQAASASREGVAP